MSISSPRKSRLGFSLVELLVGLAVITALAVLLQPMLSKVRRSSLQAADAAQLRQLSNAATRLSLDHRHLILVGVDKNNRFGYGVNTEWFKMLRPYLNYPMDGRETVSVYISPGDPSGGGRAILGPTRAFKFRSYGVNSRTEYRSSVRDDTGAIVHRASDPLNALSIQKPSELLVMGNVDVGKVGDTSGINSLSAAYKEGRVLPADWYGNGRANFVFLDGHVESIFVEDLLSGGARSVLVDRDIPVE